MRVMKAWRRSMLQAQGKRASAGKESGKSKAKGDKENARKDLNEHI